MGRNHGCNYGAERRVAAAYEIELSKSGRVHAAWVKKKKKKGGGSRPTEKVEVEDCSC